jgi:hypothetical protein
MFTVVLYETRIALSKPTFLPESRYEQSECSPSVSVRMYAGEFKLKR